VICFLFVLRKHVDFGVFTLKQVSFHMIRKLFSALLIVVFTAAFANETSLADYVNAGLPAASREWQGADYLKTVQILKTGKISLPSYSDKAGSKFMKRLVSKENLSFHRNRSIPLQSRLGDFVGLQQGANNLMKVYFDGIGKGEPLHTELADLLGFNLHVAALGVDLVNEYLPTIPKDKNYAERMAGMNQMYSGMLTQFNAAEIALTENNGFSTNDRTGILKVMAETLPTLKKVFSGDVRIELRRKFEIDKNVLKGKSDARTIEQMLAELKS
jgi:hypothetical protein